MLFVQRPSLVSSFQLFSGRNTTSNSFALPCGLFGALGAVSCLLRGTRFPGQENADAHVCFSGSAVLVL